MSAEELNIDWGIILELLNSEDSAIQQAAVLTLGAHKVTEAENRIVCL